MTYEVVVRLTDLASRPFEPLVPLVPLVPAFAFDQNIFFVALYVPIVSGISIHPLSLEMVVPLGMLQVTLPDAEEVGLVLESVPNVIVPPALFLRTSVPTVDATLFTPLKVSIDVEIEIAEVVAPATSVGKADDSLLRIM